MTGLTKGQTLRCSVCGATTVVVVTGTRGAWCDGRGRHRRVAMRVEMPATEQESYTGNGEG